MVEVGKEDVRLQYKCVSRVVGGKGGREEKTGENLAREDQTAPMGKKMSKNLGVSVLGNESYFSFRESGLL